MTEGLRLTEILTTSSAVANYLGSREVQASHMLSALAMLRGELTLDGLGRPVSPMLSRATGAGSGADAEVKALAQRWFERLGSDPLAELSASDALEFEVELRTLADAEIDTT